MPRLLLLLLIAIPILSSCNSAKEDKTPLILISIDGLKPSYFELADTPTLDSLAARGTLAKSMIPVFPTSTFPNHYSLVTGLYTENTGVISNTMYDEQMERYFRLSDRSAVSDGRWYGGEPIWVTAEKQDVRTATMFWPGSEAEINGVRPTRHYTYDGGLSYESRVDSVVTWLKLEDETRPDFITLYFSQVDSRGHSYGPYADETLASLTYVDGVIGRLVTQLKEAGYWDEVNLLFTSDHGMIDLSDDRLVFIDDLIDLDEVNIINWSPVVMMQPTEGKTQQVYEQLRDGQEHYQVFLKEDLPERWRFKNHHRVPDIVMVADLGWTITSKGFYERRGILDGTHGFDNAYEDMHTYFMAVGKDIKQGELIDSFESIHIYELMNHLLDIKPAPNDGSLDVLRPIVRQDR